MATPDPNQVYLLLNDAIRHNRRPQLMLYQFLSSKTMQANIFSSLLASNKETLKLLTSPAGRKWIKIWLDDTLNYIEAIANQ